MGVIVQEVLLVLGNFTQQLPRIFCAPINIVLLLPMLLLPDAICHRCLRQATELSLERCLPGIHNSSSFNIREFGAAMEWNGMEWKVGTELRMPILDHYWLPIIRSLLTRTPILVLTGFFILIFFLGIIYLIAPLRI